jgi:transcriptional regulator with XRE-family HTH domain
VPPMPLMTLLARRRSAALAGFFDGMDALMARRLGAPYSEVNRRALPADSYASVMGNTLKDRLELAMKGPPIVRPVDLARACGVKPPSVADWLSGRTKRLEGANLLNAAKRLGVRPEWLASRHGAIRPLKGSENESLQGLEPPEEMASASQSATPAPAILHEAVTLLLFDLDHGGPRSARSASNLLLELYRRLAAHGGRLPREEEE